MRLSPVLDLAAASPLAAELVHLRGHPIEIDASQVERLGGPCLQVLLAAKATWSGDHLGFRVIHPSQEFLRSIKLMAAESLLTIEEYV